MISEEYLKQQLVGLPLAVAINHICALGLQTSISRMDTQHYYNLESLNIKRVNLEVENNVVINMRMG